MLKGSEDDAAISELGYGSRADSRTLWLNTQNGSDFMLLMPLVRFPFEILALYILILHGELALRDTLSRDTCEALKPQICRIILITVFNDVFPI